MIQAGIDFLLPVYWGDSYALFWSIPGLDELVEASLQLESEGINPPRIGMFFDTTSLMLEHQARGNAGERPNLTTDYGKDLFYGMIFDFYSRVPPRLWARIDGKALVWLYSSAWVSDYDQSLVDYVRARFAEDFGSDLLIVREGSWGIETELEYSWGAALRPSLGEVSAIGPGFDNAGAVPCYGQSPLKRERLDGFNYRDDWEAALRGDSTIVVIETWNELHEGTEICETAELGRLYIDLTNHYAEVFKRGSWNGSLLEMDARVELHPTVLGGEPGERVEMDFTVTNGGWRSWPQRLDLSLLWLAINGSNRYNEAFTIQLPSRLLTGESRTEVLEVLLPDVPGTYRVILSTGFIGKRLEIEAVVPELRPAGLLGALLISSLILVASTDRDSCPSAGKT